MFRLFECCALSFFERFVLSFSLKIERFVSDSAEIWICGLYMTLFACNPSDDAPSAPETNTPEQSGNAGDSETNEHPENDENEDTPMENNTLKLTVNGRSFTATLVKNSSTEALMKQLAQGSVDIRMNDYGDMEKVGSLGFSLPRNDRQTTTSPGDLILYQGNSFVIYYDTNSWNFTRLGKVDGVSSRNEMLDLLGGKGEVTVTLSLAE